MYISDMGIRPPLTNLADEYLVALKEALTKGKILF